ncbi:MAG TPA: hypothetical protein VFC31_15825 [Candidatus Limnocylindria bacterium]|nr:hypothetical protein [Candidatus Limnocylindria bacterium]
MHASAIPSINDIGGLLWYLASNPYLFISSSTVMTSGLLIGAVAMTALPRRVPLLHAAAPTLAAILAYFGLGSFALSLEILLRFHSSIPYETEVQFVSGIGHLAEAGVGLAVLIPHLRAHTRRDWLWGHTIALGYWTFQIAVLTPPWFSFQGQREIVMMAALLLVALAAGANALLWMRAARAANGASPFAVSRRGHYSKGGSVPSRRPR